MSSGTRLRPLLIAAIAIACSSSRSEPETPSGQTETASTTRVRTVSAPDVTPEIRAAVDAPDRTAEDRALDPGRRPAELLSFFGIRPGMRVAELAAGGGYTAELLARVVGPSGKVYGHNSPFILERFAEAPWAARLAKPIMANVARVDREFEEPLPPEVKGLDAILLVLFYHDTVWMKTDRARMNESIYAALRPGGVYGVVDHSAQQNRGVQDTETIHRIEERVVVDEITRAGFILEARSTILQNPSDLRDWNPSPKAAGERRGQSDRFVLRFVKPAS